MKSLPEIYRDNQRADTVSARQLVDAHGENLVGQKIITQPMGDYPGGKATVIEIAPDFTAPEIVFDVEHPTFGRIGVFEYEQVRLVGSGD